MNGLATFALAIVIIIIILFSLAYTLSHHEGYKPCYGDCNTTPLPPAGLVRLNPFHWPYSAFSDPMAPYRMPGAIIASAPLTNLFTPDHVVLTN